MGRAEDPILAAGLFEGDIANVTMEDLRLLRSGEYTKAGTNIQT